jgi:hypothetical protein
MHKRIRLRPPVPALHLGTPLSAQLCCLRSPRSQMEFGNEEGLEMIYITHGEVNREADQADEEKFDGKRNHPLEMLGQIDEWSETQTLQQKEEQRINGEADSYRDADEKRHKAQHGQSTFSQHKKPDEKFVDEVHAFRTF